MTRTITLVPGDGIGPEVSAAVVRILKASGAEIEVVESLKIITARADRILASLTRVLADTAVRTRDMGGTATTTEFTNAMCRDIESGASPAPPA